MPAFCHLHCHTQYSLLDGAARIERLMGRAVELGIPAVGITDHGNLYGLPEFANEAGKRGLQAVLGCEFYLTPSGMQERSDRTRYHQVVFAKNEVGYRNLIALSSRSYLDGYYYKPRIDRELLARHSEGLIATTCCLQGEVPQVLLKQGEDEARKVFEAYLDIFGEDYYIELQDHGIEEQKKLNTVLVRWANEYGVKVIATNDVHYVDQSDAEAHDILLCIQTKRDLFDPTRMRFTGDQFYLKSAEEMQAAFPDLTQAVVDEALDTTGEIADKCRFSLSTQDLLMPHYPLPDQFSGDMDGYLRHLVFERARNRYPDMGQDVVDRLNHELGIIREMGYAGYFLIVQDFTTAAAELGVRVGPGRGSAAGSAVAYCLGITNVEPLRYGLLFERFLNPERVSMPDIDIDFDDRGRSRVIDYVVEKYGRESVCQIVTYGTMGARSAIRDVARVLGIPLSEADRIANLIPESPKASERTLAAAMKKVPEFRKLKKDPNEQIRKLVEYAFVLEGSARHTGVHAAGVIIAPGDVSRYVPVALQKGRSAEEDVVVTQWDGNKIEDFGLLKMDFLGLKTLTILNDALDLIRQKHGIDIDIDQIPLDDPATFKLFQRGETVAVFQFESEKMREYMRELRPTDLNDLIAMNALYRPGPMDMIPHYIARKHGREDISYPHPMLEEVLEATFGIPVYQEQVMQMAQVMGGYSLGQADLLRRAMGKKKQKEMDKQRAIFVEGAGERGVEEAKADEVFALMAKFAGYGFNKSHAAAYSIVAYQTAYLKANYAPEFMAAVMRSEMSDSKKLSIALQEAQRMGLEILPPSVNKSDVYFAVDDGAIRFGLGAIRNVGVSAITTLLQTRAQHGPFLRLHQLCRHLDFRSINKKMLESLAEAGALDDLEGHRAQLVEAMDDAVRFAIKLQRDEAAGQSSLFGGPGSSREALEPPLPVVNPWPRAELLKRERELTGFYVSGHPLEPYAPEVRAFANIALGDPESCDVSRPGSVCGIVTGVLRRTTRNGRPFVILTIEDFSGQGEVVCFSPQYEKFQPLFQVDELIMVRGAPRLEGGQIKIKANDILSMQTVRDRYIASIVLKVDAALVDADTLTDLHELCDRNRGGCKLYFDVSADGLPNPVRLRSRTFVVDPSPELMRGISRLFGIENVELERAQ